MIAVTKLTVSYEMLNPPSNIWPYWIHAFLCGLQKISRNIRNVLKPFYKLLDREVAVLQEENSHLKRLLASSSSRPGTPHNYRNSPGTTPVKRGK